MQSSHGSYGKHFVTRPLMPLVGQESTFALPKWGFGHTFQRRAVKLREGIGKLASKYTLRPMDGIGDCHHTCFLAIFSTCTCIKHMLKKPNSYPPGSHSSHLPRDVREHHRSLKHTVTDIRIWKGAQEGKGYLYATGMSMVLSKLIITLI